MSFSVKWKPSYEKSIKDFDLFASEYSGIRDKWEPRYTNIPWYDNTHSKQTHEKPGYAAQGHTHTIPGHAQAPQHTPRVSWYISKPTIVPERVDWSVKETSRDYMPERGVQPWSNKYKDGDDYTIDGDDFPGDGDDYPRAYFGIGGYTIIRKVEKNDNDEQGDDDDSLGVIPSVIQDSRTANEEIPLRYKMTRDQIRNKFHHYDSLRKKKTKSSLRNKQKVEQVDFKKNYREDKKPHHPHHQYFNKKTRRQRLPRTRWRHDDTSRRNRVNRKRTNIPVIRNSYLPMTRTPQRYQNRMMRPAMRNAPSQGMIKLGGWSSPGVLDTLIQVGQLFQTFSSHLPQKTIWDIYILLPNKFLL